MGADPPRQLGILKSSTLGGAAAALLWAGASAPGGPWQRLVTPLVEVAGTRFSTLVAPAQGLATLPDAYQACWAWRGQRAGSAALALAHEAVMGIMSQHRNTCPWTQRGDQGASQGRVA